MLNRIRFIAEKVKQAFCSHEVCLDECERCGLAMVRAHCIRCGKELIGTNALDIKASMVSTRNLVANR